MHLFPASAILRRSMLKKAWIYFIYFLLKALVGIRYRIKVKGTERLTPEILKKKGGIIFLPNHSAQMDPLLVSIALWTKFHPRPVVVERYFYMIGIHYVLKIIGSLPLPDLNGTVNKWKQKKIEKIFGLVSQDLKKGDNFLIYPSGRLKVTAAEIIGGASFVHNLLKECPETNIVLIRTTGLWGSRFSRAITGSPPNLGAVAWEGLKVILKNGIFLTPRRDVLIEMEPAPVDFPLHGSRLEVNQYLEKWYNKDGPEPLKLVSDLFWKKKYPKIERSLEVKEEEAPVPVSPEIEEEIYAKIGSLSQKNPETLSPFLHLARDVGLDSLDVAQLYVFLEERYEIEELTPGSLQTIDDVLKVAAGNKKVVKAEKKISIKTNWPTELGRPSVTAPVGKTITEAFLRSCDRMDNHAAAADGILGVMTYRRLKLAALTLSRKIRELEGDHIGILLPSSTTAFIAIFAVLLAKKIPVMFNWTVGVRAIDHCANMSKVSYVLSSRKFLNNLNDGDLGKIDDCLVLLEDLKGEIVFRHKLAALFDLLKNTDMLLKDLHLADVSENDPAVILFTSGTEALPKGVPLSHRNILSNQSSAISCIDFQSKDVFYGVLPPFHSFGFSAAGLLPLLTGIKGYYAPDPTDAHGMASDIEAWKVSVFCCAPTFIRNLFKVANPKQLSTLRYIIAGAEKTPEELFQYVEKNLKGNAELLEGYGITECSPIVAVQRPTTPHVGVGPPIPGVELCVVDAEQGDGEICISGPNVFTGYLGEQKSPFVTLEGKTWYRSGDRGHINPDGMLILSGRLKRFVKIGGEMISLGGLEEEILQLSSAKKWPVPKEIPGPSLAIAVRERESEKPLIILFTTFDILKEDVNLALRDCGYGRIIKISEVHKLDQIPVTSTGKIHYSALDELV